MFGLYIKSVIVWVVMIWAAIYMNKEKIIEKGWLENANKSEASLIVFIAMAVIPIMRVVFLITPFAMANMTREELDEWLENL